MRLVLLVVAFAGLAACASRSGRVNPAATTRIMAGMERLGASDARRRCLAEGADKRLDDDDDEEAARLVERARSRDDMREEVLSANERVRRAFIGASLGCSLSG